MIQDCSRDLTLEPLFIGSQDGWPWSVFFHPHHNSHQTALVLPILGNDPVGRSSRCNQGAPDCPVSLYDQDKNNVILPCDHQMRSTWLSQITAPFGQDKSICRLGRNIILACLMITRWGMSVHFYSLHLWSKQERLQPMWEHDVGLAWDCQVVSWEVCTTTREHLKKIRM